MTKLATILIHTVQIRFDFYNSLPYKQLLKRCPFFQKHSFNAKVMSIVWGVIFQNMEQKSINL